MESYGSGQRPSSYDRRMEIVSGKSSSIGGNQIFSGRSRSPDLQQAQNRTTRASQGTSKPWGFTDPEMKRKKRIAKYKVYTVEGKVKSSLRKGLRWIKNKCSQIVHGY
ncbi:hypothetical protein CCACVL1_22163 [Corchorus capsularis]|uniref:DUF3511 domain-containing protein n=1 Tax=Corchorus capsularis TaxID=210143 RepID=A0A1R3H0Q6_COCAP|nr:hypothetical protein CCACVL1_22163 [Corchorus capsularis]